MAEHGRDNPTVKGKLASAAAELAGEAAKEAASQTVGGVFSFGYMIVLTAASIVILIGVLVVCIAGWAATTLAFSNVPEARGLMAPFWGVVALVLLFLAIRWAVRRFGRPIERRAEYAVETIHQAIDSGVAGFRPSSALPGSSATMPMAASAPAPAPTLAELDARLASQPVMRPEE